MFAAYPQPDPEKVFNVPRILKRAFSMFLNFVCITLSINNKWDVNLIFNSENSLKMFLKLLIFRMQTVDGRKGTGIKLRNLKVANEIKSC